MMSIVRNFGAPVIDPGGKAARTHSTGETSARRRPRTVETSWWRVWYVSTCISFGTETLPSSLTAPRSLRSRSTIMRFSARVFSLVASVARIRSSSAAVSPRGAVPLIGFASIPPSRSMCRKRSGDELRMLMSPNRRKAACGAGLRLRSSRYTVSGSIWTPLRNSLVRQIS